MFKANHRARLMGTTVTAVFLLGWSPVSRAVAAGSNIETVVVTGTKDQATDIKKNATVVLDIAPLEQIRSLPDANAAEALQRLPGVQMESDTGEGRFINIRGMDADLNGTTYDGVRMMANNPSSPQGGARAVAFDSFPAGMLGGIEVIKTLTPEIDGEGLGGVVNIQPRVIPEGSDHIIDASIGGGIESLRGSPVYKADVTLGQRLLNDKLSLIASYGYEQDHRGIDDIEEDYAYANDGIDVPPGTSDHLGMKEFDNLQFRRYQYHRMRQGVFAGITYDLSPTTQFYLRGFHAGYTEVAHKHEFVLSSLGHNIASIDSSGNYNDTQAKVHYADINTKETLGNDLAEIGGSTLLFDTVKVDARLSWTEGHDEFPYGINVHFNDPNPVNILYNNTQPNIQTYSALGGVNLADPTLYTTASGSNSPSQNADTEYAGVLNFSVPLPLFNDTGLLKFGGSVRERTRGAQRYAADLNPTDQNLADYVHGPNDVYYHGRYNLGPFPIYPKLLSIPQAPVVADPTTFEHDSENVFAGYAQYSVTFDNLDVTGGVRVEHTDGTYNANTLTTDALGNTAITPNSVSHGYTNVFPDVSLTYHTADDLQFRAAYSTAIARPGFNQITAARSVDLQNAIPIVSQGNPGLQPTLGRSVDLVASYFLPDNGIVSAGLFYKSFEDYISTQTMNSTSVTGFVGQTVQLTTYQNIGGAHVDGIELQYNQQFEFLPDPLKGFGFEGNLTYVQSRGQIRPGEKHALPQTSPFAFNAALLYDNGPLSLKLASSYVSTNLWVVGGSPTTDQYSQPRFRLDFGASYNIMENVQAYFDVKNITNTHLEFTYTKSKDFPIQNEFYGSDYLFGVRVTL